MSVFVSAATLKGPPGRQDTRIFPGGALLHPLKQFVPRCRAEISNIVFPFAQMSSVIN